MASTSRKRIVWHGGDGHVAITRAEGLLQKLRDTAPEARPDQTTIGYLARHYHTSIQTMKQRIADAERSRSRNDQADAWLETLYQIGNELGETLLAKTFQIARDTSNRNAFNAQKFLLAKLDPEVYGDASETAAPATQESRSLISDVPQEVFDELNEIEEAQLVEIEQALAGQLVKLEQLVRRVQKRVADRRVTEDNRDVDTN
jgi:hypothetical protein